MRSVFLLMCILCLSSTVAADAPVLEWAKLLPSPYEATSIAQTHDGGYVVVGWDNVGYGHGLAYRITPRGDTLWSRVLLSPSGGAVRPSKVIVSTDGQVVIAGYCDDAGNKAYIAKLSDSGIPLWTRSVSCANQTNFADIEEDMEGCFVAVGYAYDPGTWRDFLIVRTNGSGDTLWTRRLSEPNAGIEAAGVELSSDTCYLVAGDSWNPTWPLYAKISHNGDWRWSRFYGSGGDAVALFEDAQFPTQLHGFGTGAWTLRVAILANSNGQGGGGWTIPLPSSCQINAVTQMGAWSYILAGWTGYSPYNHAALLLKLPSSLSSPDWSMTVRIDATERTTHFNDVCSTSDGGFIAAGRSGTTSGSTWLLMKYCPEGADAGEVTVIKPGPPDWGFALYWRDGESLDTLAFTGMNAGAIGDVTGSATLHWTAMPGGDGNNGDSIIFAASQPLDELSADTFWIRGLDEDRFLLSYVAGCPKDTVATQHGGHLAVITNEPNRCGFTLVHDVAQIRRIAFTSFAEGTVGSVTGVAAATWSPLPNGDGNNGDSIIFVTNTSLTSGSLDTFWLLRSSGDSGLVQWSVGCFSGQFNIYSYSGHVDSVAFSGAYLGSAVMLSLTAYNVQGVLWFKIFGRPRQVDSWHLESSIPAVTDTGMHSYSFNAGGRQMGYSFMLAAEDSFGEQHQYLDCILTVGQNVPADPKQLSFIPSFFLSSFPNPFNPSTTISFSLPREAHARVAVFDILGREVVLLTDEIFIAGEHRIVFDGASFPSGIYFARLQSGSHIATSKLLLLK